MWRGERLGGGGVGDVGVEEGVALGEKEGGGKGS